jgi:hypothetical protein|tara:strand:- start:140 stop:427 length:288 start_codon:yes stop_codon:yes gene_type:complete
MVAFNNNPAEELINKVKESVSKKYVIIGGIACVFLAAALIAAVAGVTYVATWFLAYLWNVGIAPFGIPTMTWWQVTAIWTLFALVATVIKKIFSS